MPSQSASKPTKTQRWRTLRAQVLANATHCALCHKPLDFNARPRSTWAPSVDHVVPLALGGSQFDPANCQPAHCGCNSSKRDRLTPQPATPSRSW